MTPTPRPELEAEAKDNRSPGLRPSASGQQPGKEGIPGIYSREWWIDWIDSACPHHTHNDQGRPIVLFRSGCADCWMETVTTAYAKGRAEGLEAAAQRVEASRFRPHEEEPNIVDSALDAAARAIRALGGQE